MGTSVETQTLRGAARAYVEFGRQLHDDVSTALPKCSIPGTAIPTPDSGFAATYGAAYTAADLGVRACADVFTAVGNALTRVANHYEDQESENAKMFGGRPIPAPAFPAPREMSTSASAGETTRFLVAEGAIIATLEVATIRLMIAASAIPALFVHFAGIAALALLKDPIPYFNAAAGWGELEKNLALAGAQVLPLAERVVNEAKWEGDGADAFLNFVSNQFDPAVNQLLSLVSELKNQCVTMGVVMSAADLSYLIGTALITTGLIAAAANPEPATRTALGWGFATQYVLEVSGLIVEVAGTAAAVALTNGGITTETAKLNGYFGTESKELTVNSAALTPQRMTEIQTWEQGGWTNKKVPEPVA
ncbi:hypothetical protein [Asanoa iriomotensis]|uniref:Excreted virulence factor EspC (Type VII ESX diderm) n=1 Tax=Asanoa iriomotensis TaxID=234613 RepID=A0ABQ4BX33_9ACTN|nr:hypothetical protein [Asanoa iriomotensis]GIF55089.1 hypothetical protein Air01nite_11840 [Asanoa iriomotensis]